MTRIVPFLLLAACSFTPPPPQATDGQPPIGNEAGAEPVPPVEGHLLFTEVLANGVAEFVEIHNPSGTAVALTDYYLTDVTEYWELPGFPGNETIAFNGTDFFARFPAGSTIAAGATIVVAVNGVTFLSLFGRPPTFTIITPVTGAQQMLEVISPTGLPSETLITDEGELLVLLEWDGASDTVTDVDILVHGVPGSSGNRLSTKTPVDGPDVDSDPTAYAAEPDLMMGMTTDANATQSYKRIMAEGTNEPSTGGNGIDGHDETSEQVQVTWNAGSSPATPFDLDFP